MSNYLERILRSFEQPQPRLYEPAFRIDREGEATAIYDGDRQLGAFYPLFVDFWAFSPFEEDVKFREDPPGKVVDLHTLRNTTINLGAHAWPKSWLQHQPDVAAAVRWEWEVSAGQELIANVHFDGPEEEWGVWRWRLRYDAAWGRYRLSCDIHVRKLDQERMEPFNVMTAGALASRPEDRRWTHSIWESMDNRLRRIVHSNALFQCTDYGGARDGCGPWRWRYASYPKGWIGYAAHESFNPVAVIHHTNTPIMFATCSQLFDEHLIWSAGGQDILEDDGFFHFKLNVEIVNLEQALATELLEQAADPVKPTAWHHEQTALPFRFGTVNDFESPVDPWEPEECPIIQVPINDDGPIARVADVAHRGSHSLRLACSHVHRRVELFPTGAVFIVKQQTRYRFSAWVRTENVFRFARLELGGYEYSFHNILYRELSEELSGDTGWTRLAVELDSRDQAYIMPIFVLYGSGRAWFDEALLEEI